MTRKKPKIEGIGNIIKAVIKRLDVESHGFKEDILKAWQKVNEKKALAHTRPIVIRRKILTIEVDSSAWLYELNLKKKGLLTEMQKLLGKDKVEDIRFRMGEIT